MDGTSSMSGMYVFPFPLIPPFLSILTHPPQEDVLPRRHPINRLPPLPIMGPLLHRSRHRSMYWVIRDCDRGEVLGGLAARSHDSLAKRVSFPPCPCFSESFMLTDLYSALRRLANASSSEYKQTPRGDVIPAYNPSTTSTTEKPSPANTDSPQDEIMPVLSSNPSSTSSATQRRLPPSTATPTERPQAPPPSYLPRTVVRAMTDRARPDRYSIPFIWRNELARGGLMFVTRALSYVLM